MTASPQSAGDLLRELVDAQDDIDKETSLPLGRRSSAPLARYAVALDAARAHLSQASERADGVMVSAEIAKQVWDACGSDSWSVRQAALEAAAKVFRKSAAPAASVSADARDSEALQEELTHERQCVARFSQLLERAVRVVDAARGILRDTDYCRGMPDDMPSKGAGNFLADAMVAYDAAMEKK